MCSKSQHYWEDKEQTSPGQPTGLSTLCSICMVYVFFTLIRSLYTSTSSISSTSYQTYLTPCVRADSSQRDTINIYTVALWSQNYATAVTQHEFGRYQGLRYTWYFEVLYKPYPILTAIPYRAYILFFISSLQSNNTQQQQWQQYSHIGYDNKTYQVKCSTDKYVILLDPSHHSRCTVPGIVFSLYLFLLYSREASF